MVNFICKVCGKPFTARNKKRLFCSRKCSSIGQKKKQKHQIKSICKVCDKEIFDWRKRITCSIKCAGKHHKKLIKLGLVFMPSSDTILKANDKKRKEQNYQGNYDERVYRKICGVEKCCLCDEKKWIDAHHIDKNRKNNKKENLIPLCRKHHKLIEKLCFGWNKTQILTYFKY